MKNLKYLLLILVFSSGCDPDYSPKPFGYFRIDTPEKEYQRLSENCPYSFEYNTSAKLKSKNNCWFDIRYPDLKATLQLTYREVSENNLDTLLQEGHDLAYNHTVRADGIDERLFQNRESKVYGLMYSLKGDVATSLQFYMTDSTNHFLRGVLYYYASPNADSLQPANQFMEGELVHLIETLKWEI